MCRDGGPDSDGSEVSHITSHMRMYWTLSDDDLLDILFSSLQAFKNEFVLLVLSRCTTDTRQYLFILPAALQL